MRTQVTRAIARPARGDASPLPTGPPGKILVMPTKRKRRCRRCGQFDHIVGRISNRGLCAECSGVAVAENVQALQQGSGPAFDHWKASTEAGRLEHAMKIIREANAQRRQLADRD